MPSARLLPNVLLLVACGGTGPAVVGDSASPTTPTEPTEPVPRYVQEVRVNAYIAWDADAARVVAPTIDGDPARSALVLTLSGAPDGDLLPCTVVIDLEGATASAPVEGVQWRLELAADHGLPITSDCSDAGYAAEQFPDGDPVAFWQSLPWTLSVVGGTRAPALDDALEGGPIDAKSVLQGRRDGAEPFALADGDPLAALSYWQGFALVDGDVATTGERFASPIAPETLDGLPPGELPTGYWVFDDLVVTPLPERLRGRS